MSHTGIINTQHPKGYSLISFPQKLGRVEKICLGQNILEFKKEKQYFFTKKNPRILTNWVLANEDWCVRYRHSYYYYENPNINTHTERERVRERERERKTDRQTDRQADRETERERHTRRQRDREREREGERSLKHCFSVAVNYSSQVFGLNYYQRFS